MIPLVGIIFLDYEQFILFAGIVASTDSLEDFRKFKC